MIKILFTLFTIGFVGIRAYYHQPDDDTQIEIRGTREKWLAGQFTVILLMVHGWWLGQSENADLVFDLALLSPSFIGACMMGASLPLLIWVHHSLGSYFSARLVVQNQHEIIRHGPYRWIRHPMYTVGFLYLIGAGLLSQSWVVSIIPTFSFALLVGLRIHDEETMLCTVSEEYRVYMKQTGRFLPKIKANNTL